jgi:hypothetical protein
MAIFKFWLLSSMLEFSDTYLAELQSLAAASDIMA